MMSDNDLKDLDAVSAACRDASETILQSLETILTKSAALGSVAPDAAEAIEAAALRAMEACGFQDLVGQRLGRIRDGRSEEALLFGPQDADAALSQDSVDALFG